MIGQRLENSGNSADHLTNESDQSDVSTVSLSDTVDMDENAARTAKIKLLYQSVRSTKSLFTKIMRYEPLNLKDLEDLAYRSGAADGISNKLYTFQFL